MKTSATGQQTISVSQQCMLMLPRSSKFKYSNCRIIVVQLVNGVDLSGGVRFISGDKGYEARDAYVECGEIKMGTYLIYVEMEWGTIPNQKFFNVTCYGAGNTTFEPSTLACTKFEFLEASFKAKCFGWYDAIQSQDTQRELRKEVPLITRFSSRAATEGY